jgi:putative ABC transport system ATP-binding protein
MEVVKTVDLTKSYGKGEARIDALKNANLTIRQGEMVAVVGPSGSGKSTLLHLLGGVDRPTSGKVYINGEDIYSLNERQLAIFRRRNAGFIFQSYNLIPVLTAEENILLPLLLDNRRVERGYLDELLKLLGLEDRRRHLPGELSGGQQQRVSIGRALAYKPSIILADEPTGNLDSRNGKEIIELLRVSAKKYHQTLVIITHDVNVAAQADRVIGIEDGMIAGAEAVNA